jgi:hypothetical protein
MRVAAAKLMGNETREVQTRGVVFFVPAAGGPASGDARPPPGLDHRPVSRSTVLHRMDGRRGSRRGATSFCSMLRAAGMLGALVALSVSSASFAGPFDVVDQLDAKLVSGQSTMEDVRRLLGKPNGRGAARFPPAWTAQEIRY